MENKNIKNENKVDLSVNPCKMCMPLGGVMALKGIEGSMVILHGSQGCSTYIRRHMASHYNEPIDIASSSLTENGTIYGGAKNLKEGLKNIIQSYKPKLIGVLTTCLSETIGEDISRIVSEFQCEEDLDVDSVKIVPISTPSYSGTQSEGYYKALRRIVEELSRKGEEVRGKKINIIAANMNPGDIRNIKSILKQFAVPFTIFPDVSDTLDGGFSREYDKIPSGGTSIKEIAEMGNAVATIEIGLTVEEILSPGSYLEENFAVPLFKCPIPIGLRNTDLFLNLITQITGKLVPEELIAERRRYLDGMIDSHKHNSEGKVAIFGEPELVYSVCRLCMENGVHPALIATGAKNAALIELLKKETEELEEVVLLDDTDFKAMESYIKEMNINLMIGDSNGRRIEERLGVKLVRIGFPIHDRVGGQRQINTGFNGSLRFLDEITNALFESKETTYRKEMYSKYFKGEKGIERVTEKQVQKEFVSQFQKKSNNVDKTKTHPCYNQCAHDFARMHIPVAPKCNISCNYCSRKYDCVNESRPGVTSVVLSPEEALEQFKEYKAKMENLTVVGIAGPGDALANFDVVKKSIELIKRRSPDITFCMSTNGLMLPFYANEILALGISHLTITINTVDEEIGAKLYSEINYLGEKLKGVEGAKVLLHNQLSGLKYLSSRGVTCKVNIVMVKGVNDSGIEATVKKVKEYGAFMTNIMPMISAPGSKFEHIETVSTFELNHMRKQCEPELKQMYHCRQCRADAVGTLSNSSYIGEKLKKKSTKSRYAVTSKTGINIDQHFGHASEFYIYDYVDGEAIFIEKRAISKYCTGKEECDSAEDKIDKLIKTIEDCKAVLTFRAGDEPIKRLKEKNIHLYQLYSEIKKGIQSVVPENERDKKEEIS